MPDTTIFPVPLPLTSKSILVAVPIGVIDDIPDVAVIPMPPTSVTPVSIDNANAFIPSTVKNLPVTSKCPPNAGEVSSTIVSGALLQEDPSVLK